MNLHGMTGTVTEFTGRYFVIECPDAPPHLRTLHLVQSQMGDADVGDVVHLAYQVTSHSGLWNVIGRESRNASEVR